MHGLGASGLNVTVLVTLTAAVSHRPSHCSSQSEDSLDQGCASGSSGREKPWSSAMFLDMSGLSRGAPCPDSLEPVRCVRSEIFVGNLVGHEAGQPPPRSGTSRQTDVLVAETGKYTAGGTDFSNDRQGVGR